MAEVIAGLLEQTVEPVLEGWHRTKPATTERGTTALERSGRTGSAVVACGQAAVDVYTNRQVYADVAGGQSDIVTTYQRLSADVGNASRCRTAILAARVGDEAAGRVPRVSVARLAAVPAAEVESESRSLFAVGKGLLIGLFKAARPLYGHG